MRWAWIILGSLVAVPLLVFTTFQLVSLLAHEEETHVFTFAPDEIETLDVSSDMGGVVVVATDGPDITVTAHVSRGLTQTHHSEEVVDGVLRLRSSCNHFLSKHCSVDYTIEMPRHIAVVARTGNARIDITGIHAPISAQASNGGVSARNVSGTVDLRSSNGSIDGDVVRGSLRARTDNGSVRVVFREPPDDIQARSENGSVTIVVPETDDAYALDLSTDNGRQNRDVRTDPTSSRTITAHTSNGSVTVRYP